MLYVSIRFEHRIAAYDATTGVFIRDVVRGNPLATLAQDRRWEAVHRSGHQGRTVRRAGGMFYLDGWLYFRILGDGADSAGQPLRRARCRRWWDILRRRAHQRRQLLQAIAVSDGIVRPARRGVHGPVNIANGMAPAGLATDGTPWHYAGILGSEGPGEVWDTLGYGSSVAVAGRLP